jgi:predicted Zn finger-like uncharacterized protein
MLLTCPSCETRYQVDEAAIDRAAGRQVRCANCGYLWHFAPSLEENLPAQSAPAARTAAAGPAAAQASSETNAPSALSTPLDLGSAAAPAIGRMGHGRRAIFQAVVILVVATAVLVPILARNTVVQTWPEATKVYDAVGLKTAGPGTGLDIKVTPLRSEGSFVVTGEITNTTDQPLSVPPLRVLLRDSTQREVEFQIIDPPVGTLPAGRAAQFRAVFEHPSVTAIDVVATFGPE